MADPDLHFQKFAHDKTLGGASPTVDGGPTKKTHHAHLAPQVFHQNTSDKTVDWELQQIIEPLGDLLKDEI